MKTIKFFGAAMMALALASCGGNKQSNGLTEGASGDMEAYEQSDVNAVEQARFKQGNVVGDLAMGIFDFSKEKLFFY
jgi:hypothetical protein